ncbi:MAG TPA: RNA polymerase sigma-70 factor [Chitinophagaceae bacterium]|jgi:RNA polymerase sigma-70 factor (ECF subfamily)|nr:RNA polymerase sigma-70 factor [Chitinophagaceae bacterium]
MLSSLQQQLYLISKGDENAFREMVHLYGDRLYQFVMNMVKSPMDAEEIISDVFLKVWQLRRHLPDAEKFPFYLYRAVKHTSLNYLKKKNRKKEVESAYFIEVEKDLLQNPEDIIISKENLGHIRQAINTLPQRCRQILMLVKEDNLSYRQVAELLDISTATVNVQMTIAVKKLWHTLDPSRQGSHS